MILLAFNTFTYLICFEHLPRPPNVLPISHVNIIAFPASLTLTSTSKYSLHLLHTFSCFDCSLPTLSLIFSFPLFANPSQIFLTLQYITSFTVTYNSISSPFILFLLLYKTFVVSVSLSYSIL